MSTDVTEHSCRICRGEATQSQPLYHPCKCRGSIKYVHQDCLMEWLKHANKSTEKCDICDTPYKFRIIYDPAMPQSVPLSLIWMKLLLVLSSTIFKAIAISLYILCILIQVPLFLKFTGRVYTWAIDGSLPVANQKLLDALFFGEYDIKGYLSKFSPDTYPPIQLTLIKLQKFLSYTYFSGVRYIVAAIIVHIALFIEREWVVRDEGYLKLLYKKIGKEPRTKLVDMLQNALQSLRNDGNNGDAAAAAHLERLETLAQAINDLQNENEDMNVAARGEEGLRRAINENQLFPDEDQPAGEAGIHNIEPVVREQVPAAVAPQRNFIHDIFGDENEEDDHGDDHYGGHDTDDEPFDDDEDVDEDDEEAAAIAAAAAAAADNVNGNGNNQEQAGAIVEFLEMFGITLSVKTPVYLMVIIDCVIVLYLFLIYLIPHMLGSLLAIITNLVIHTIGLSFVYLNFKVDASVLGLAVGYLGFINLNLIQPLTAAIDRLFISRGPYNWTDRVFLLSVGYGIVGFGIYKAMQMIRGTDNGKPITGTPRKVYKVLFEIACTLKVAVVLKTEIVLFPIFCGLLLDFTARPFIPDVKYILASSHYETLQVAYIRLLVYWGVGTLFMVLLAMLVDSARKNVLRTGVLFFLRTPDDPNIRIIHDALVVPLKVQVKRIYLTGKVYFFFIVCLIYSSTWCMFKLMGGPDYNFFVVLTLFSITMITLRDEMKDFGLVYLTRVIQVVAHRLRLSHYVIGFNSAEERGFVKRWYHIGPAVSISTENGTFVPDGHYMRVPSLDSIPKKYLNGMFIRVTKSDIPIEPIPDPATAGTGDNEEDYEESDIDFEPSYTVVYVPPYFKVRAYLCLIIIFMFVIFVPLVTIYCSCKALGMALNTVHVPVIKPTGTYIFAAIMVGTTTFAAFKLIQRLSVFFNSLQDEVLKENYMKGKELVNVEEE